MVGDVTPVPSLDTSALTSKQLDMANARNPMSGNQSNQLLAEQSAQNKAVDDQRKGLAAAKTVQQQQAVPTQAQTQAGSAAAGAVQKNLTTFSNRLAAKVNSLMSGGDINKLQIADSKAFAPVWNPDTGQFEIPSEAEIGYDTEKIAQSKLGEIAKLKEEISPYFDFQQIGDKTNVQAKSFEDVLKQFADLDGDGQLDPSEQKYLNESFQIASMITRYENLNPDSVEAAALRKQLQLMDEQGLVSGIYRAMDQYKALTGSGKGPEFYGELGQNDFNIENLVNMTMQDMEAELNKALTGQESVFGQDFESALTQNRLRSNFAKSLAFDTETRNVLTSAARDWGNNLNETFSQYRDQINQGFAEALPKLQAHFQQLIDQGEAQGQNTDSLKAALQWFDDLDTEGGPNDAARAFQQLLSDPDSGLAVSQRQMLAKWLGETTGTDMSTTGIISSVVNSLKDTGGISVAGPDGEPMTVEFTDKERLDVARIMADPNLTDPEKAEKVNAFVNRKIRERIDASGDLSAVQSYFDNGNFQTGLEVFAESIAKSLATFADSATKALWNSVVTTRPGELATEKGKLGEDPRNLVNGDDIASIQGAMDAQANAIRSQLKNVTTNLIPSVEKNIVAAEADLTELQNVETTLSDYAARARAQVTGVLLKNTFDTGLEENMSTLVAATQNKLRNIGVDPNSVDWGQLSAYAETFTGLENLRAMISVGGRDAEALMKQPEYKMLQQYIEDPMAFVKTVDPTSVLTGTTVSAAKNFVYKYYQGIRSLLTRASKPIFDNSDVNKDIMNKYKNIADTRRRLTEYVSDANGYLNEAKSYAATGANAVQALTTFNQNDVANMAMAMARAAEAGATGPTQFIDLSKYNLSAEDFDKLRQGIISLPPVFQRSAVQFTPDKFTYTPVMQGASQNLRQWAGTGNAVWSPPQTNSSGGGAAEPTPYPTGVSAPSSGYVTTGGSPYSEPTPSGQQPVRQAPTKVEWDPTKWSIGGWKPFG